MIKEKTKMIVIGAVIGTVLTGFVAEYQLHDVAINNHQLAEHNQQLKSQLQGAQDKINQLNNSSQEILKRVDEQSNFIKEHEGLYKQAEQTQKENDKLKEQNEILSQYHSLKKATPNRGGSGINQLSVKKVKVEVSAYSRQEFNNNTSSGTRPVSFKQNKGYVTIAAPKEISFGTEMIIPGLDKSIYTVEDRGGYIKKVNGVYRLDIFVETTAEAFKIGRHIQDAYIIVKE